MSYDAHMKKDNHKNICILHLYPECCFNIQGNHFKSSPMEQVEPVDAI